MIAPIDEVTRVSSIPTIDGSACLFSAKRTFTGSEIKRDWKSERLNFKLRNVDEVARGPSPAPPMSLLTEGTPFSPANRKPSSRMGLNQMNPPLIPSRLEKVRGTAGLKVSGWSISPDELNRSRSPIARGSDSPIPDPQDDTLPSPTRQTVLDYSRSHTPSFSASPGSGSPSPIQRLLSSISQTGPRSTQSSPLKGLPALARPSVGLDRLRVEQLESTARNLKPEELKAMARNSVNGCPLDQLVSTSPKSAPPHGFNRSKKRLSGIYLATKLSPCQQDHSDRSLHFGDSQFGALEVTSYGRKRA